MVVWFLVALSGQEVARGTQWFVFFPPNTVSALQVIARLYRQMLWFDGLAFGPLICHKSTNLATQQGWKHFAVRRVRSNMCPWKDRLDSPGRKDQHFHGTFFFFESDDVQLYPHDSCKCVFGYEFVVWKRPHAWLRGYFSTRCVWQSLSNRLPTILFNNGQFQRRHRWNRSWF